MRGVQWHFEREEVGEQLATVLSIDIPDAAHMTVPSSKGCDDTLAEALPGCKWEGRGTTPLVLCGPYGIERDCQVTLDAASETSPSLDVLLKAMDGDFSPFSSVTVKGYGETVWSSVCRCLVGAYSCD